jgi:polyphosphate:AMP phosphotransferase
MFETAELGQTVSKGEYAAAEPEVHTALLEVQRRLRAAKFPVIVIVSGVEGAGKGEVVNLLNTWLDARGIQTHAFWDETDEERRRPSYWRFWRALPPRGTIGILFGSWYTRPIIDHVFERIDQPTYERELHRINEFEQLLAADGALIVKFWFHLTKKAQQKRLKADISIPGKVAPPLKKFAKRYRRFVEVSERAIRVTDTGRSPWHIIEAADRRFRNLTVGQTLLGAIRERLERVPARPKRIGKPPPVPTEEPVSVLNQVNLDKKLSPARYDQQLRKHQDRLYQLGWKARARQRNTVIVFEGWDAAGKGGAIRRLTAALDARLYRVISIAAPTDEEKAQHYLWRFWRHIPRDGYVTIYDRSWYGRVLVERVEGFAEREEWERAYQEINDFEEQLVEHGTVLVKFWLHISAKEQLRRFKEREAIEWKKHKITEEDWRNREKWHAYEAAVNDMVGRTSTEFAPWSLIAADDKRSARVTVVRTVGERLRDALG